MVAAAGSRTTARPASGRMLALNLSFKVVAPLVHGSIAAMDLRQLVRVLGCYQQMLPLARCNRQLYREVGANLGSTYMAIGQRMLRLFSTAALLADIEPVDLPKASHAAALLEQLEDSGKDGLNILGRAVLENNVGRAIALVGIGVTVRHGHAAHSPASSLLIHVTTGTHDAVKDAHVQMVKRLVERGADVNLRNDRGQTLLMQVADSTYSKKLYIKLLLACGASLTAEIGGSTALHYAAEHGHRDNVEALLEAGADVNVVDCDNETPLNAARQSGDKRKLALFSRYAS
jgi:hypothetical protein